MAKPLKTRHKVYAGQRCDNLVVMRNMADNSVDLIYLDPPFNSKRLYDAPIGSEAEGAKFSDKWSMTDVKHWWLSVIADLYPAAAEHIHAVGTSQGNLGKKQNNLAAYLIFMGVRLIEIKRLLKSTGTVYLHCDPAASHYLKVLMDSIFGAENFRNEIVWAYTGPSGTRKNFPGKHDILLRYSLSSRWVFNADDVRVPYKALHTDSGKRPVIWGEGGGKLQDEKIRKEYLQRGKIPEDWWDDIPSGGHIPPKERVGYPTQKPIALMARIIKASSNEGDLVLDPFCGCATTNVTAAMLNRNSIGIDISAKAGELVKKRLRATVDEAGLWKDAHYHEPQVTGTPPKLKDRKVPFTRLDYSDHEVQEYSPRERKIILDSLFLHAGGVCPGCGKTIDRDNAQLDRINPRSYGGKYTPANVQFLCAKCNRTKGGRPISNEQLQKERKHSGGGGTA